MPKPPTLEIQAISLRVGTGELAVVIGAPSGWNSMNVHHITLHGDEISRWSADVQLKAGLFVTTGHPAAVPGIRTTDLLHRTATSSSGDVLGATQRQALIEDWCQRLDIAPALVSRHLDAGFSPSEGVAVELLQLAVIRPDAAIIDLANTPAADASRTIIGNGLRQIRIDQPDIAVVVITDEPHLIADLAPDHIHHLSVPTTVQADRDETML